MQLRNIRRVGAVKTDDRPVSQAFYSSTGMARILAQALPYLGKEDGRQNPQRSHVYARDLIVECLYRRIQANDVTVMDKQPGLSTHFE